MRLVIAAVMISLLALLGVSEASARLPDDDAATRVAQPQGPTPQKINQYDWNNDSCPDLIVRNALNKLYIFLGACSPGVITQFQDPVLMPGARAGLGSDVILLPGDLNGDTCPDIMSRPLLNGGAFDGSFFIGFGDCNTGFINDFSYAFGNFDKYDWFAAPGSWDGSGCPSIIGHHTATKELHLFQGNCGVGPTFTKVATMATGFEGWNWMMAPSHWDSDSDPVQGYFCGDLITRRTSDAGLLWYDGDCAQGFSGGGATQVGFSWGIFDWILSGANWSNDTFGQCTDVLGRRSDDGTLRLYQGNCNGAFGAGNINIGGDIDWRQFNYIVGDAGPVVTTGNPTVTIGPTPSPTATPTLTPTPTPNPSVTMTVTPTPTPTFTPGTHKQGDANCDGAIGQDDAELILRAAGGLALPPGALSCIVANGNTDCANGVSARDVLPILFFLTGFEFPVPSGCTPVGETLSA